MRLQRKSPTFLNRCIVGAAGPGGLWGNVNPGESVNTILQFMGQDWQQVRLIMPFNLI